MRFNTAVIVISGAAPLVDADPACTLDDFALVMDLSHTNTSACLVDQDSDVWAAECLTGVTRGCASAIEADIEYYIDDVCDYLDVPNSFDVCRAVSLGISMTDNAPTNSSRCTADDMAAIWYVNMTTVCLCANETISMAYTCTTQALDVSDTCTACFASREAHVDSVCGPICDEVDNDPACSACINAFFAESVGRCAQASSAIGIATGLSGLALILVVVGLLAM